MAKTTAISWTEATWNPWYGCTKVSPGCANCYMFRDMARYDKDPSATVRSATRFDQPLKWREPRLIFTCSWSDWFHERADEWRAEAWDVIRRTPWHTYQILTKRPERIRRSLPDDWGDGWPNVWLGTSIESQRFDWRAAALCEVPAAIRFVSAEPLLGPLDLTRVNWWPDARARRAVVQNESFRPVNVLPRGGRIYPHKGPIHWVIAGGESGPEDTRREMDLGWMAALAKQCAANGAAFFCKQDSSGRAGKRGRIPDHIWNRKQMPAPRAGGSNGEQV